MLDEFSSVSTVSVTNGFVINVPLNNKTSITCIADMGKLCNICHLNFTGCQWIMQPLSCGGVVRVYVRLSGCYTALFCQN